MNFSDTKTGLTSISYSFSCKPGEESMLREFIGEKAVNLLSMNAMKIPIPRGFILSNTAPVNPEDESLPEVLIATLQNEIETLEKQAGKKFGDPANPLLLSVRFSNNFKMENLGAFLNLGLNDALVGEAEKRGELFYYDAYLRLLFDYAKLALNIDLQHFFSAWERKVQLKQASEEEEPKINSLPLSFYKELINEYHSLLSLDLHHQGSRNPWESLWSFRKNLFPQDAYQQLYVAVQAMYKQWYNPLLRQIKERNGVALGARTALIVQEMVFGNRNEKSANGVAFSRNLATGEKAVTGEFLLFSQGQNLITSSFSPQKLSELEKVHNACYKELLELRTALEFHFRNIQEIEFVIDDGKLWILQASNATTATEALIRSLCDMYDEKLMDEKEVFNSIELSSLSQLLFPVVDPKDSHKAIAQGLGVSSGAVSGKIVLDPKKVRYAKEKGVTSIFVKETISSLDFSGISNAAGVLTKNGLHSSYAAENARALNLPCITDCKSLTINPQERSVKLGDKIIHEDDTITIDGSTGNIYLGELSKVMPALNKDFYRILDIGEKKRHLAVTAKVLHVRDIQLARQSYAKSIFCHTEFLFTEQRNLELVRKATLSENAEQRIEILRALVPLFQQGFLNILDMAQDLTLNFRFLEPPLHEFLPREPAEVEKLAEDLQLSTEETWLKLRAKFEFNPTMGHKGVRTAVTHPEFYQVLALAFAKALSERMMYWGKRTLPSIALPFVSNAAEMNYVKTLIRQEWKREMGEAWANKVAIGAILETPMAILNVGEIGEQADFLILATDELSQFLLAIHEADSHSFLSTYINNQIFPFNPFTRLDQSLVGRFIERHLQNLKPITERSLSVLTVAVMGSHAEDPISIEFFDRIGIDEAICSPARVPIVRMAAALSAYKQDY